jgi:hypothetical protein
VEIVFVKMWRERSPWKMREWWAFGMAGAGEMQNEMSRGRRLLRMKRCVLLRWRKHLILIF